MGLDIGTLFFLYWTHIFFMIWNNYLFPFLILQKFLLVTIPCFSSIFIHNFFETLTWTLSYTRSSINSFLNLLTKPNCLFIRIFFTWSSCSVIKPVWNRKWSQLLFFLCKTVKIINFINPWWKTDWCVWSICLLIMLDIFWRLFKRKNGKFIFYCWFRSCKNLIWYLNNATNLSSHVT